GELASGFCIRSSSLCSASRLFPGTSCARFEILTSCAFSSGSTIFSDISRLFLSIANQFGFSDTFFSWRFCPGSVCFSHLLGGWQKEVKGEIRPAYSSHAGAASRFCFPACLNPTFPDTFFPRSRRSSYC